MLKFSGFADLTSCLGWVSMHKASLTPKDRNCDPEARQSGKAREALTCLLASRESLCTRCTEVSHGWSTEVHTHAQTAGTRRIGREPLA